MIIKRQRFTHGNNVIARITRRRPNPDGAKSGGGVCLHEGIGQNLAGPTGEEHSVRQLPILRQVSLAALGSQPVHLWILRPLARSVNRPHMVSVNSGAIRGALLDLAIVQRCSGQLNDLPAWD
jgi:hypothetical protein